MEVVVLALTPTHRVTLGSTTVDIHIPFSVLLKAEDNTSREQHGSRNFICIRFKKECAAQFGRGWNRRYITYDDLRISPIPESDEDTDMAGECCQADCDECRDGLHAVCGYGCTLEPLFIQ